MNDLKVPVLLVRIRMTGSLPVFRPQQMISQEPDTAQRQGQPLPERGVTRGRCISY
jgi:hypothetical protein